MNELPKGLKAIMFDLGGVIIGLDYHRAASEFARLARIDTQEIGDLLVTSDVLQKFEVGRIGESEFRKEVCSLLGVSIHDDEFDNIWNSLLLDVSTERIKRIRNIELRTLILSNTNSIHERAFNKILVSSHGLESLHELVDHVYFSHEVGLRKPDPAIYEMVLKEERLKPQEILFIDDRTDNIQGAELVGIITFLNISINDWLTIDELVPRNSDQPNN